MRKFQVVLESQNIFVEDRSWGCTYPSLPPLYLHKLEMFFLWFIPHFKEPKIAVSSNDRVAIKRNEFNIVNLCKIRDEKFTEISGFLDILY